MKNLVLFVLWGCLHVLCVGLGTVREPEGFGKALLVLTSLIYFLPAILILWDGISHSKRKQTSAVRWIAMASLGLTLILLVVNFLSVGASTHTGRLVYDLLNVVSAPMLCSQYWVVSLFVWACLFWASFFKKKR